MKICKTCDATKMFQDFYAHPKAKDGLDSTCKECRKEKVRINRESKSEYYKEYDCWRYANQPQVKERHKKYRKTDQGKSAINRGKALWANKNPEARAAHVILGNAVRDGELISLSAVPYALSSSQAGRSMPTTMIMLSRWKSGGCVRSVTLKSMEGTISIDTNTPGLVSGVYSYGGMMMTQWEQSTGATDEWYTPKYIFNALGEHFDIDVAAPDGGPLHVPTTGWFSSWSLDVPWAGFIWMNPPFGGRNGLVPWLDKFFMHGNGIALTPDRSSAPWWQDAAGKADGILNTRGKVKFIRPDGSEGKSPNCGTTLWAAGERAEQALRRAQCNGLGIFLRNI